MKIEKEIERYLRVQIQKSYKNYKKEKYFAKRFLIKQRMNCDT